jgi:hypothetical protein
MPIYNCEKCEKEFTQLCDFQKHVLSINGCELYVNKKYECENCGKKFSTGKTKNYHQETSCIKGNKDNKITMKELLLQQQEEIKKMKEKIETLEKTKRKPGRPKKIEQQIKISGDNNINIGKQKIINDNSRTNNVIINFGQEDISMLTNKEKEKILNKAWSSIVELIKVLHCNEKRPETRNICLTNLRSNDIYVYENGKFRTKNKEETINDLIQVRAGDIQEILEEYEGEMKEKTRKALMNLLDLINDKDEEQLKKTNQDVSRLLYDENKKINKE